MYPYSLQFSCGCSKTQFKCEFTYRKKSELCQLNFGKKSVARMMNRASDMSWLSIYQADRDFTKEIKLKRRL